MMRYFTLPSPHEAKAEPSNSLIDWHSYSKSKVIDPKDLLEKITSIRKSGKTIATLNGSEYGENCLEAETVKRYGGKIHIVSLIPGLSTSQIIKKLVCYKIKLSITGEPTYATHVQS